MVTGLAVLLSALSFSSSLGLMIVLTVPDAAQAQASLDVDLSGQQQSPSVPPVPDTLNAVFVDAQNGSDSQGNGSRTAPIRPSRLPPLVLRLDP
ncbi:MAG: hypothetical protein HC818_08040 [Synechococcaceae cyanobacterium RM1_1_27]|nr:hypothetical protein [Synechococcaceae cyanobacterium RM1_1_27]